MTGYSNTVSLSSSVLTRLYESDWCVASRRTLHAEKGNLREDVLDSTFDRPAALYHLHNGLSTIIRVAATIATYTLVAPVGLVYHTTKAFKHHFQMLRDLRCFSNEGNRHFRCAGAELVRVAEIVSVFYVGYAWKLLPSLISHRIDLMASYVFPLLNHPVCRTLAGYVAPYIDSNRLYDSVYRTLYQTLCTSLGIGLGDLALTIFYPVYNSRSMDASDQDISWRGKMACKWELGFEGRGYQEELENEIKYCAQGILKTIGKLKELLPHKHKLPYDPEVRVHRLLRYLEDSRKELSPELWEQIRPLRDELEHLNTVMLRLKPYLSIAERLKVASGVYEFPKVATVRSKCKDYLGQWEFSHESKVEMAFSIRRGTKGIVVPYNDNECEIETGNERSTTIGIKKRPLSLLRIHAFTQMLFKKVLSSDFFYPSNVYSQPVDDLGCIQDTLSGFDPYERRSAVTTWHHRPLKPIRFAARLLAKVVILGLGCPLGTIGHGAQSLRYLTNYALGSSDDRFGNWERVQAHARAMFDDLGSIFGIIHLLMGDVHAAVKALATTRADRAGMIKAILLKNTFGITRKDGGLLYYSSEDDVPEEWHLDPYFVGLYANRSLVFVAKLKAVYGSLSKANRSELEYAFNEFLRCGSVTHFETILATEEGQNKSLQLANVDASQQKKRECLQALNDLVESWHCVIDVLQVTEAKVVSPVEARRTIRPCAFSPEFETQDTQSSWWQDDTLTPEWLSTLENTQKAIKEIGITEPSKEEEHVALKQRVMDEHATPKHILGFNEDDVVTRKNVAQKFRALAPIFHSDKLLGLSEELKKEKGELYKILSVAKTMLTVNLPKDTD